MPWSKWPKPTWWMMSQRICSAKRSRTFRPASKMWTVWLSSLGSCKSRKISPAKTKRKSSKCSTISLIQPKRWLPLLWTRTTSSRHTRKAILSAKTVLWINQKSLRQDRFSPSRRMSTLRPQSGSRKSPSSKREWSRPPFSPTGAACLAIRTQKYPSLKSRWLTRMASHRRWRAIRK